MNPCFLAHSHFLLAKGEIGSVPFTEFILSKAEGLRASASSLPHNDKHEIASPPARNDGPLGTWNSSLSTQSFSHWTVNKLLPVPTAVEASLGVVMRTTLGPGAAPEAIASVNVA